MGSVSRSIARNRKLRPVSREDIAAAEVRRTRAVERRQEELAARLQKVGVSKPNPRLGLMATLLRRLFGKAAA